MKATGKTTRINFVAEKTLGATLVKKTGNADGPLSSLASGGSSETSAAGGGGSPHARESVPMFGGNVGRRKRADGLKPGSDEAKEADKRKDAIRKRMARAETAAQTAPPPLPSASGTPVGVPVAERVPIVHMDNAALQMPGMAGALVVQWQGKDVEELTRKLIELTEEFCSKQILSRCRRAKLQPVDIEEIKNDARWKKTAKEMLEQGGSELFAMALNKSGVPPEYKPFILVTIGAMEIALNHMKVLKRLDALIEQTKRKESVQNG
jgi:hypothetical protein